MAAKNETAPRWLWGIILVIVVFVMVLVLVAVFAFQQDVNMVTDHYYEKDLNFEKHQERLRRTRALDQQPRVEYMAEEKLLRVAFPVGLLSAGASGAVHIYRPSDAQQDRHFDLALEGDTLQVIPVRSLSKGLWRTRLSWQSAGL